jgi:tetratricopeptide (TPR) repeat protein
MKGFRSLFNLVEKCDDLEIERVIDLSLEEIFDESISSSKLQHEELHNVYFMRGYYAFKKNEYDKSETFFERIYNCSHESYQYEKDIAVVSHLLGIIWTHKQLYLKAKDALERSIESLLKIGDQLYLAKVHNSYGNLLSLAPRCYNEAEKHYELALNICESEPGSHNLEIALTLNGLAELYLKEGKYDKALILCMRVLNIYENILLPENTSIVTTLNNLATVYCKMGGYGIALKICNRALGICENLFMHENSNVATTLNNLAMVYYKMGEYSRAFPLCKRTLDIRVNALGAEHLDVATSLNNLALLYDQMREREASTFCISELNIYENMY